ncbi:MAG: hypothetical protein C4325_03930 [Blastocatellia bacterium]
MSPHDTEACITLAKRAGQCQTIVSIDIDKPFPGIERLLGFVDVLIASSSFPQDFTGIADLRRAIATIADRFGNPIVGVTLGEAGSLFCCQGNFVETKGFAVPGGCKDTTGAGDSFRAGFLFGLISGENIEESARIANAVAALKCRAIGARTALPHPEELRSLLTNCH